MIMKNSTSSTDQPVPFDLVDNGYRNFETHDQRIVRIFDSPVQSTAHLKPSKKIVLGPCTLSICFLNVFTAGNVVFTIRSAENPRPS